MIYRRLILLVLINMLVFFSSFGQATGIRIADILKEYNVDDTLNFVIVNESKQDYFFKIGLDKCTRNKWHAVKEDIFQCCTCFQTSQIYVKGLDRQQVRWSMSFFLTDSTCPFRNNKKMLRGNYRLYIVYTDGINLQNSRNVVSDKFKIRK